MWFLRNIHMEAALRTIFVPAEGTTLLSCQIVSLLTLVASTVIAGVMTMIVIYRELSSAWFWAMVAIYVLVTTGAVLRVAAPFVPEHTILLLEAGGCFARSICLFCARRRQNYFE